MHARNSESIRVHVCDVYVHVCDVYMHVCDVYVHVCDVYVHVCDVYMHVCDVYMHVCDVYVHVCDVHVCGDVYVHVRRHQDGGVEVTRLQLLDDNNFGAISRGSGAFAANGLSSTHTGHISEPAMPLPVGSTPLGSLELAAGPYRYHGHQWLRRTMRSTWCALTVIFTAKVPGSHSPQGCLVWAWPAHPFDSLSALETGPRQ